MVYVRFTGRTPYLNTDYEDYLSFEEQEIEDLDAYIMHHSTEFSLDNARKYVTQVELGEDPSERNENYLNYLQTCISFAQCEIIDKETFEKSIDNMMH